MITTLSKELRTLTLEQIAAYPGVEANRADILLGGLLVSEAILEFLSASYMRASKFSLRHGLLARATGSAENK